MSTIRFAFIQWLRRLHKAVDGFWFDIRLKYQVRKYGGGDKIPAHVLKDLMGDVSPESENALRFAMFLMSICEHYKLEVLETRVGQLYADLLHERFKSAADEAFLMKIISAKIPALELHATMLEIGDISIQKYQYFGPPPPYDSVENWLLSL